MEILKEFLVKLTSRKFLLTVFATIMLLAGMVPVDMQYSFILLICGYILGNVAQKSVTL
jgi:hypothetical protein